MRNGNIDSLHGHPSGAVQGERLQPRSCKDDVDLHPGRMTHREDRAVGQEFVDDLRIRCWIPRNSSACINPARCSRSILIVTSTSWVARGAPRMATAWAPKTNHGISRSSNTSAKTASVSPTADMRGLVEQGTHTKVRLQVCSSRVLVGPARSNGSGSLVELHCQLDLAIVRLRGTSASSQTLWCVPVTTGVLTKLRGIKTSHSGLLLSSYYSSSHDGIRCPTTTRTLASPLPCPRTAARASAGVTSAPRLRQVRTSQRHVRQATKS